jgi:hypothetical protein
MCGLDCRPDAGLDIGVFNWGLAIYQQSVEVNTSRVMGWLFEMFY